MYALKLKTARLCSGIRLKCFLLGLAFFIVSASSFLCLLSGVLCAVYGVGDTFGLRELLPPFFFSTSGGALTAAVLILSAAFLFICSCSLIFVLKSEFYYAADRNLSRPRSFASFGCGVRYLRYKTVVFGKKTVLFARFLSPFFICLFAAGAALGTWGMDRLSLFVTALALVFLFVFGGFCFFVWSRQYDAGVYLMYLNRMLSPRDAAISSEEKTAGRLLPLAVYRVSMLPRKLGCVFPFFLPFFMTFAGVFSGLVCEKLYGEDKRKTKLPTVTFYINKKTRFELKK